MAAVIALIAIYYGIKWAATESFRANRKATTARRATARQAASQRGTSIHRVGSQRRAARQAAVGYWANALRHGFPVEREGLARGWRDHQHAAQAAQTDGARERADHEGIIARLRAETAAHRHRLEVAARQRQQTGHPNMSHQLRVIAVGGQSQTGDPHMGAPGPGCTDPDCSCHATDPLLPDGRTPGSGPPQQPGPAAAGSGPNGHAPATNGGPVDFNLDQILATAKEAQATADHAVNAELLDRAIAMGDATGQGVPNDATANGHSGDMAAAAIKIKEGFAQLTEAAQALHEHMDKTYSPEQEALDASGQEQPEKGLLQH